MLEFAQISNRYIDESFFTVLIHHNTLDKGLNKNSVRSLPTNESFSTLVRALHPQSGSYLTGASL